MEELVNLLEEAETFRGKPDWTSEDEAYYQGLVKKFESLEQEATASAPTTPDTSVPTNKESLPAEDQELLDGIHWTLDNHGAAAVIGLLDGLSPVGAKWLLEKAGMNVEAIEKSYPGAMESGEWAGLVIGLANVPGLVARATKWLGKKAFNPFTGRLKLAKGRNRLISLRKEASSIARDNVSREVAERALKDKDIIDSILTGFDTKLTTKDIPYSIDEIIKAARNKLHEAEPGSVLKDQADMFSSWFNKELSRSEVTVGGKSITSKLKADFVNNIKRASKLPNILDKTLDEVIYVASDWVLNYTYAYNDAIDQGKPEEEAKGIAWSFASAKTPLDVMADIVGVTGVVGKLAGTAGKHWIALTDVDSEGHIKSEEPDNKNFGGLVMPQNFKDGGMVKPLIYRNEGGGGTADRFPGLKRIQQGLVHLGIDSPGIDRVRTGLENLPSARTVAELTPVLGDALAAEEVYKELQKDPINWTMVGILGGATLIGAVPGIGDAAAKAIKAGASAAARGTKAATNALADLDLEVDPNTLGSNLGNIKIVKKGGRPKKIETFHVRDNTGFTTTFTGTQEQFSKKYGVSASSAKTKGGRLKDKSMQWNKSGEFKEFKSGAAKQQPERFDPEDIDFDYDKRASIPRSLDPELLDQLEDMVDEPLERHMNEFLDELEEARGGTLSGFWETERNALDIADRAWPEIAKELRQSNMINALDPETYNKVVQWAKNRTKRVFDVEDISKDVNTGAGKGSGYIEFDDFDPDDLGINDGIWEDVTPRNITITQPGVERRRVMKGRDQKWDHTASDVSISKMIKSKEVSPDDAKKIYSNLKLDGMIDKYGNWTDKAVKEHGAVQKKRPEFIDNKQGDINTLNNWAKKLKDPRGEMADINAKLKTNKSEMEHLQDKPLTKREVQNLERQRTAIEDLLGLENTPTTWDIPVTAEEIAAFRADLKRVMGPKPGGIIDTHFNKGGRVRRGVIPLIYN